MSAASKPRRLPIPVQVTAGVVLLAFSVLLLWASSFPGDNLFVAMLALGLLCLVAIGWFALIVLCIARRWFSAWLLIAPIVAIAVGALAATPLPDRLGFALAKPDLQASLDGDCPTRVGWYPVSRCAEAAGTRVVVIDGAGFLNSEGFARFDGPPPPPPSPGEDAGVVATRIENSWYRVTFVF